MQAAWHARAPLACECIIVQSPWCRSTGTPKKATNFMHHYITTSLLTSPNHYIIPSSLQALDTMKYSVQLIMYIVTSIVSASAIVVVTKRLYHLYGFKWPTCLIFVHQGSVAVVTWSASTLGYTERPKFTAFAIMGGCLSAFSLFLLNLSLWYNSVGTFQTFKLLTVPCIATIDYFYVGKRFTMPQILALLLMVAGTGVA